ncbi:MAG: arsenite methyltransferase [Bdellovibrionales bacterium]|nr:arsenite methyltransferase [Bdellovibrionales bacterium]
MKDHEQLKSIVREKYGEIAKKSLVQLQDSSCCGTQCCSEPHDFTPFNDDYSKLGGYQKDADLMLGCGIPTEVAAISPGDTVLDLGSGAGNDVFVARVLVGEKGRVIGLDMTEAMVEKAILNARAINAENVEFRLGEIEQMPIEDRSIDVVISNCVLNLVPNKRKAFDEIYRVLKPGGHFAVSDIVLSRDLPQALVKDWEMYAGCVGGAIKKAEYLQIIKDAGFKSIEVRVEKPKILPREVLLKYMTAAEADQFDSEGPAVSSITVYANK